LVGVDGVARLIDFGVAKAVSQLHTTREGELRGKLAYMAPEQIRGGVADRQTDVFSAAVVIWQTIAGRRLFVGNNDGELIYRLLEAAVVAPSTHRQGVPAELDRIVMKGLSRDRSVRYATALEMAHDLEESVAFASQRSVAAWVQDVGHDELKERSKVLSRLMEQASLHDDPDTLGALRATLGSSPSILPDPGKIPRIFPVAAGRTSAPPRASNADGTATVPLSEARAAETDSQLSVDARWARPSRKRSIWVGASLGAAALVTLLVLGLRGEAPVVRLKTGAAQSRALVGAAMARSAPPAWTTAEPVASAPVVEKAPKRAVRRWVKPVPVAPKPKPTAKGTSLYKRE
jgi:serine/threonine-protein kinase